MRSRTARTIRRVGALAVAGSAVAAVTVATPAVAGPARQSVTAGNARFQVLSPTVIRTEYAGDGRFTDAATFNAVGRGSFTPTPYTSTVSGGVLTIKTSATTLTYRLNSGPFDGGNLEIRTTAGAAPVLAAPWHHLTCTAGALCEAEDLTADGLGVATDHPGYTGEGFLAGFESTGNSVTADVLATTAGTYALTARYANGQGGDGKHVTRTLSVSVDGGAARKLTLPVTADWNAWALASVPVTLGAGHHSVRLERTAGDSGNVNLDSLAVLTAGAPFPPASARAFTGCAGRGELRSRSRAPHGIRCRGDRPQRVRRARFRRRAQPRFDADPPRGGRPGRRHVPPARPVRQRHRRRRPPRNAHCRCHRERRHPHADPPGHRRLGRVGAARPYRST